MHSNLMTLLKQLINRLLLRDGIISERLKLHVKSPNILRISILNTYTLISMLHHTMSYLPLTYNGWTKDQ